MMDERHLEFATTDRQREIVQAIIDAGSFKEAARRLGIAYSRVQAVSVTVRGNAARQGYAPEHDHHGGVPDGYQLRGASTLYDRRTGQPLLQWVKTTRDQDRQLEMMREAVAALVEDVVPVEPSALPTARREDLLTVYPVSDHHVGMYAWAEETGDADWDLDLARRSLTSAAELLAEASPASTRALVLILGDLFHYDGLESVTPTSKNLLDSDGRYAKMVRVAIASVRAAVEAARRRHAHVTVAIQPGNHDPSSALFLSEALRCLYEREERVEVDVTVAQFRYFRHGDSLLGVCHGHEVRRLQDLALIMATDRPDDWGATRHRYWYTGHVHRDTVMDEQGVRIESFRCLPPTDAWAAGRGYRGAREAKAIVLHERHGEVARFAVRPEAWQ